MKLTSDRIFDDAKRLGIPFRNALAGQLLEQTAGRMFEGGFSRSLCIMNAYDLSEDVYKTKAPLCLDAVYFVREKVSEGLIAGLPLGEDVLKQLSRDLFPRKDRDHLRWRVSYKSTVSINERTGFGVSEIYATAILDNYEIPLFIRLHEMAEGAFICRPDTLDYTFEPGRSAGILTYPPELFIADRLANILNKLELLDELGDYLEVYGLLQYCSVSGRKAQEYLLLRCGESGVSITPDRLRSLRGYYSNKYMKKRWKSLLRVRGLTSPAWEDALSTVMTFLEPVWEASCRQEIFFEDWMPEIGRFM